MEGDGEAEGGRDAAGSDGRVRNSPSTLAFMATRDWRTASSDCGESPVAIRRATWSRSPRMW